MAVMQTGSAYAAREPGGLRVIDWIAMVLLIVGGLNWGLVGAFGFDLVAALFGEMSPLSRIVYVLVGISALWFVYTSTRLAGRQRR